MITDRDYWRLPWATEERRTYVDHENYMHGGMYSSKSDKAHLAIGGLIGTLTILIIVVGATL